MLKKGSKLHSILTGSCPRCQKESMYVDNNILHFHRILKMHEKCGHCGLKYLIEPSFFYGAMYVSYALNVVVGIATFLISFVWLKSTITHSLFTIFGALIFTYPVVMRLSRSIYINIFVSFDKKFLKI
ncbi:MAG: hypothetical protein RLZZ312_831 [Bacteroidota bacterium]